MISRISVVAITFVISIAWPCYNTGYTNCFIRWSPPPTGWTSLDVDGSCKQKGRKAGGGGILRTDLGDWIMGFMYNIGWCSIEEAELWAVCKGLELAWNSGYKKISLGIDSEIVVKWLKKEETPSSSLVNLITTCLDLLARNWNVRVNHIYREQNKAADFLATESLKYERGYKSIWNPPTGLQDIIDEDKM